MAFAIFTQILLFWLCAAQILRGGLCVGEQDGVASVMALKHRGFGGIKYKNSFELLKISNNRSSIRLNALRSRRPHHHHHGRRHHSLDMSLPLRASSDYIMSLMLGTPPQRLEVFMDTGSDLVWVPCSSNSSKKGFFDCIMCEGLDIPTFSEFDSHSNRPESCGTVSCSAIHSNDNLNDLCIMAGCPFDTLDMEPCQNPCPPFYYAYGDGSLMGELRRDSLTVHQSKGGTREISNFTFGCARISLGEAVGVAGFGRGILPFPAQLSEMGSRGFSYCLVSHKFDDNLHVSSPLLFGDIAIPKQGKVQYTPMINNSIYPSFYYLGLEGISIGDHWLKLPSSLTQFDSEGNGGLIIDSGTTFTMLPESLHRKIINRLKTAIQYNRSVDFEEATGLDLCYNFPTAKGAPMLPTFKFHFKDNATITLPAENYMFMIPDSDDHTTSTTNITSTSVGCLIILSSGDEVYGPAAVLGNYQQQNLNVVYDMEKQRIGFLPKICSANAH
ncbi:hypothetical protein SUGI_0547490 [Cryptomeria japonica]|uniref:probable aspartyl protease At4g16563 n=1 Tax=Cryptomeria japonica TaxID=3369 RepID=UPI002408B963|nr:probable aspartyl protease At4g16563 [Cryptomeria japonica]GLJ27887.1 hypothetical protein SUGI_0547490 [Cryptomeria japonica]